MTSYPSNHHASVAALVLDPTSKRSRRRVRRQETLVAETVKHHDYREGTHPVEDRPSVRVSPLAIGGVTKTRGLLSRDWAKVSERKGGGGPKVEDLIARASGDVRSAPIATMSTEVHKPIVRAFTGSKSESSSSDEVAERMRAGVQAQWDATQAPYAIKPMKATNKLGAGK